MSRFFNRNISYQSRLARGVLGSLLLILGIVLGVVVWVRVALLGAGAFAIFEAIRGWCVVHACGIRTKH